MPQTEIPDVTQLGNAPQNMLSLAVTLLIITWIALSLRILARGFLLRSFGWDDWTMIFTVVRSGATISVVSAHMYGRSHSPYSAAF